MLATAIVFFLFDDQQFVGRTETAKRNSQKQTHPFTLHIHSSSYLFSRRTQERFIRSDQTRATAANWLTSSWPRSRARYNAPSSLSSELSRVPSPRRDFRATTIRRRDMRGGAADVAPADRRGTHLRFAPKTSWSRA